MRSWHGLRKTSKLSFNNNNYCFVSGEFGLSFISYTTRRFLVSKINDEIDRLRPLTLGFWCLES